jgi:hypothetical protein
MGVGLLNLLWVVSLCSFTTFPAQLQQPFTLWTLSTDQRNSHSAESPWMSMIWLKPKNVDYTWKKTQRTLSKTHQKPKKNSRSRHTVHACSYALCTANALQKSSHMPHSSAVSPASCNAHIGELAFQRVHETLNPNKPNTRQQKLNDDANTNAARGKQLMNYNH